MSLFLVVVALGWIPVPAPAGPCVLAAGPITVADELVSLADWISSSPNEADLEAALEALEPYARSPQFERHLRALTDHLMARHTSPERLARVTRRFVGALPPDAPDEVRALAFIRSAQFAVHSVDLETAHEALGLAESFLGDSPLHTYQVALLWCELELHRARYASAAQRAEDMRVLLDAEDFGRLQTQALANLAHMYERLARYEEFKGLCDDVLRRTAASPDVPAELLVLTDRCNVRREERDPWGHLADANRVLEVNRELPDAYYELVGHFQRALALRELGRLEEAEADFRFVVDHSADSAQLLAAGLDGLARVALDLGQPEVARERILAALSILRERGLDDYRLDSLQTLALVHLATGETRAIDVLAEAEELLEATEVSDLGPRPAARLRSRYASWSEIAQDAWAQMRERGADASATDVATRRAFEAATRWGGRSLAASLGAASGLPALVHSGNVIAEVRRALPPDSVLVQFANGGSQLYAYVLTTETLDFHILGDRAALQGEVQAFVDDVLKHRTLADPRVVAARGHALYRRLVTPLGLNRDLQRWILVPTAELATLPFEALVERQPDEPASFADVPFLLDGPELVYAPTAWLAPLIGNRPPRAGTQRALLIGDPRFSGFSTGASTGAAGRSGTLERLEQTRAEVLRIGLELVPELLRDDAFYARHGRLSATDQRDVAWTDHERFDLYCGSHATADVLAASSVAYDVLHFATHSLERPLDPASVALVLSPDERGDRLLTVGEIRALDLDAQLVVLSACSTAVGPLVPGDGVQSLAGAFLESGAREVVASLTRVADEPTRELITAFYRRRAAGQSSAGALRSAKRELRGRTTAFRGIGRERSSAAVPAGHPSTWAPFVYLGLK